MFQYIIELNLARSKSWQIKMALNLPTHSQEIVEDSNIAVEKLWKNVEQFDIIL